MDPKRVTQFQSMMFHICRIPIEVFWRAAHKPQLPNHPAFEVPAEESGQTPAVCIVHIFGTRHGPISIPHHKTMGNLGSSSCPHPEDGFVCQLWMHKKDVHYKFMDLMEASWHSMALVPLKNYSH